MPRSSEPPEPAPGEAPTSGVGTGEASGATHRVRVSEQRHAALAGVHGADYLSPAQSAVCARALVRIIVGREPRAGETRWVDAVAGGTRRTELIDLGREAADG